MKAIILAAPAVFFALTVVLTVSQGIAESRAKPLNPAVPKIIVATSEQRGALPQQTGEEFVRQANERLAGQSELLYYHTGQMGQDDDLWQKLKLGTIRLAIISESLAQIIPPWQLYDLPFLIHNRNHVKSIEENIGWPILVPAFTQRGFTVVAFWEKGFHHFSNNSRPIITPADLASLKLAVNTDNSLLQLLNLIGAQPVLISPGSLYNDLKANQLDGQESYLSVLYDRKLYDVQRYLSLSAHTYTPSLLVAWTSHWEKIPLEVRQTISQTAREVQAYGFDEGNAQEQKYVTALKTQGMSVNEVDRKAFQQASSPVYQQYAQKIPQGKELLELVMDFYK